VPDLLSTWTSVERRATGADIENTRGLLAVLKHFEAACYVQERSGNAYNVLRAEGVACGLRAGAAGLFTTVNDMSVTALGIAQSSCGIYIPACATVQRPRPMHM
jgi:hypothetical protein